MNSLASTLLLILCSAFVSCQVTGPRFPPKPNPRNPAPSPNSHHPQNPNTPGPPNYGSSSSSSGLEKIVEANASKAELAYQSGVQRLRKNDFSMALVDFQSAEALWGDGVRKTDAWWGILRSAPKSKQWKKALESADKLWNHSPWNASGSQEILMTKIRSLEALNDFEGVVLTSDFALQQKQIPEQEAFRLKGSDAILSQLSSSQLQKIRGNLQTPHLKATAYFRLGEKAIEDRDRSSARHFFQASLEAQGDGEWAHRSHDWIDQIDSIQRVRRKTIGVVLPLSGRFSQQGLRTLRGLQMGLGPEISIAIMDSDSNPDQARKAVESLVREDQVIAIVGSLTSRTATSVASKASELDVPSIALSQKSGLTEIGPLVFRNAMTSEMQVSHLVHHAMINLGQRNFAILYPNEAYGVEFANLFWDEVLARGGQIVAAQIYKPGETDFRVPVRKLVQSFDIDFRKEEYRLRLKAWKETSKKPKAETPDDLLPPLVDFDALFIPDSLKSLGQIAPMLSYAGIKNIKILGTNLWNNGQILRRAGAWAPQVIFVDGVSIEEQNFVDNTPQSPFVQDYQKLFGENPGTFDYQGYDTGVLIRLVLDQGVQSREDFARTLSQVKSLQGSQGEVQINEQREVVRPIFSYGIQNNQIFRFTELLNQKNR
ncbi:MAG: penicillin-binding protein activator [Bdellovibrio sp.]